ncbi:alpha/beta fold hydrolase [Streptomyces sp. NPDC004111]|uniref:alpha/beta hydrolase n=1 Tax=Streptomyces sp. NPDC004111 TaxID=3364690 RepID=UPI0036768D82
MSPLARAEETDTPTTPLRRPEQPPAPTPRRPGPPHGTGPHGTGPTGAHGPHGPHGKEPRRTEPHRTEGNDPATYPPPRTEGTSSAKSPQHPTTARASRPLPPPRHRAEQRPAAGPLATPPPRPLTLDAGTTPLSALLAEPSSGAPRATILAVHGRGTGAAYWNSFLPLATALGHTVLAVDRPGYGQSADFLPEGLPLAEQGAALHAALKDFSRTHDTGAGVLLLGHSDGGKVALHTAASEGPLPLLGLDTSGTGYRYHPEALHFPTTLGGGATRLNWGPLHLYPPGTFKASRSLLSPTPVRESAETVHWPRQFEDLAPRVRVPVRLTFAEHEHWWELAEDTLAEMAARLTAAPSATTVRLPSAGHNISLGLAAPAYHLAVLTFLEQCLTGAA